MCKNRPNSDFFVKIKYMKKVILVDKNDKPIRFEEKIRAHEEDKLHRCFSILVFNSKGDLLIQKRAKSKYHSGGLWSNTCCSHPLTKNIKKEAEKRLQEEMGFSCSLKEVFSLIYNLKVGKLYEHEFNHVLTGIFDEKPKPNPGEAEDWKWVSVKNLKRDIKLHPKKYASWFKLIVKRLFNGKEKQDLNIFIGSDHAGFRLKNSLKQFLKREKYDVKDLGSYRYNPKDDYPDYAHSVCKAVLRVNGRGILICSTGQGMGSVANKVPGIIATICWDEKSGKHAAMHNLGNVLCLGGNIIKPRVAKKIVKMWLNASRNNIEKRHIRRINKIRKIERRYSRH